jgi:hypothetical protein
MSNSNDTNWYGHVFKAWQVKLLGSKPTADMLSQIHKLNARPGKQALACAMALRAEGVTNAQIVIACGAPQLNKMRGFITDALLKRLPVPAAANGHQVYKLELTAKGLQRIKQAEARAAKQAEAGETADTDKPAKPAKKAVKASGKAKGTRKAKAKAEAAPVEPATSEAAPVTEAATETA